MINKEAIKAIHAIKSVEDLKNLPAVLKGFFGENGFRKDLLKPRNLYRIFESTLTQEQKAA